MGLNFDQQAAKGNQVLNELAMALGIPDEKEKAGRILRSVLHALRNQLTLEESIQLMAQLPMFLKAVYVSNWMAHKKKRKIKHLEDFLSDVLAEDGKEAFTDFPDGTIAWITGETIHVLSKHLSSGEVTDIIAIVPVALKDFIRHHMTQAHNN